MIDSGAFDVIGRPSMRFEGPTSWGVWLRILDSAASGKRCGRVKCGVLYHVAEMKVYFHGEEQPTRELLLPLLEAWTHVSLDACPERQLGGCFRCTFQCCFEFGSCRRHALGGFIRSFMTNC